MKALKPQNDYVLVETLKPEEVKTKSGLIMVPDGINTPMQPFGVIHAVGPEITNLKVGQCILYSGHAGLKHTYEGKTLVFLKYHEIVAVVE